jgi:threonyl-tRNA synthetase
MQFINKYEYEPQGGEVFTQPSKAVPDQTISLKTLVTKYVKGMPISAPINEGIYTDDNVAQDFTKLDLADQEQITEELFEEFRNIKSRTNEQQKQKYDEIEAKLKELEELKAQTAQTGTSTTGNVS